MYDFSRHLTRGCQNKQLQVKMVELRVNEVFYLGVSLLKNEKKKKPTDGKRIYKYFLSCHPILLKMEDW